MKKNENETRTENRIEQCFKKKYLFLIIVISLLFFFFKNKSYLLFMLSLILLMLYLLYISIPFLKATEDYEKKYKTNSDEIKISKEGSTIVISKEKSEKALIFYQGGFIENKAYIPFLYKCAKEGIIIFLVKMPLNFSFLNIHSAIKIVRRHKEIKHWFIGGHSLGGVAVVMHVFAYPSIYEGIILLGSYPSKDISNIKTRLLSISASNDGIIKKERARENRKYLPKETEEVIIKGGNHSQFGNYGFQKKDGKANISREEQQSIVVKSIISFIIN